MTRASVWRAVAAEHLAKAQASDDAMEAALHMGIASDLQAKALTAEISGDEHGEAQGIDFEKLRASLRQIRPN